MRHARARTRGHALAHAHALARTAQARALAEGRAERGGFYPKLDELLRTYFEMFGEEELADDT